MKNDLPFISIITIVYNGAKTIEFAIKSVINQNYPNIEYIIIDGGSNDGTIEIIKKYETRITKWISEKDKGIYDAINKGIRYSQGDIIGIVNSDDFLEENTLCTIARISQENEEIGIYHGLLTYWDNGKKIMINGTYSDYLPIKMIEHPTCFVRKEVYDNIGLFNCRYKAAADYDFMLRAKEKGIKFMLIPVVLSNFSSGGITSSFTSIRETLKIMKNYKLIKTSYFYFKLIFFRFKYLLGINV